MMKAEIEAQTWPGTSLVICDRGLPDVLAYHRIVVGGDEPAIWSALATAWMPGYEHIFVARPDPSVDMTPDVLRVDDPAFRGKIQQAIEQWLTDSGACYEVLAHGLSERVERIRARLLSRGSSLS